MKNLLKNIQTFLKTKVSSKAVIWSLVGVVLLLGALALWESLAYNKSYAQWEIERTEAMETIERLDYERKAFATAAAFFEKEADKAKAARDLVIAEWEASRAEIAEEVIAVTELPPSELATAAAKLLEVAQTEVRVTDFGLEFSLVASQRVVQGLTWLGWHYETERPQIQATLALFEQENYALRSENSLLKQSIVVAEEEIKVYAEQAVKDAEMVKKANRRANIKLIKGIVGTVVVGVIIYVIIVEVILPILRK